VPTWFAVPFTNLFGTVDINYTPTYKVYVSEQTTIDQNTVINMAASSSPTQLGNALTFSQDGSFVAGGVNGVPAASIGLFNSSAEPLTVGLAGLINLPGGGTAYHPFCAFTLNSQNSIIMTPLDTILLVASESDLQSGNVQATVSAPGCTFSFTSSAIEYDLQMVDNTFAITNQPGTTPVDPVASGTAIATIVNATA